MLTIGSIMKHARSEPKLQYFFICGAPKSGTTWLQKMLDAHPEIVCSGEGHFIVHLAGPLSKVIRDYNDKLTSVNNAVYQDNGPYSPVTLTELASLCRFFIGNRIAQRADDKTRAVGDKTPAYHQNLGDLRTLFPSGKFIHILRDPRDVAVSVRYHGVRSGLKEALVPGSSDSRQLLDAGTTNWVRAVENVANFRQRFPDCVLETRYEKLLDDPLYQMKRIAGFLSVSREQPVLRDTIAATSFEPLPVESAGSATTRRSIGRAYRVTGATN